VKLLKTYRVPALIAVLVLGSIILLGTYIAKNQRENKRLAIDDLKIPELEIIELPHGRVLYAIVEKEGVYLGEKFVAFPDLEKYLKENQATLRPQYALVLGTESANYGKFISVFSIIRSTLKIPATINTVALEPGTRRGPIEVHENHWEYDF
jgi:hypothetical protein